MTAWAEEVAEDQLIELWMIDLADHTTWSRADRAEEILGWRPRRRFGTRFRLCPEIEGGSRKVVRDEQSAGIPEKVGR